MGVSELSPRDELWQPFGRTIGVEAQRSTSAAHLGCSSHTRQDIAERDFDLLRHIGQKASGFTGDVHDRSGLGESGC